MKYCLLYITCLSLLFLSACSGQKPAPESNTGEKLAETDIPLYVAYNYDTLTGIYKGSFGKDQIRIVLTFVSDAHVAGYNIVKGLQRNISGSVTLDSSEIFMNAAEPGDDPYDGTFSFRIDPKTFRMTGTWTANDPYIGTKSFQLEKFQADDREIVELDENSFANYFYTIGNEEGDIFFENDGFCTYVYYPGTDDPQITQLKEITGSWNFHDSLIEIDWQPNTRFDRKLKIRLIHLPEEGEMAYDFVADDSTVFSPRYW